MPRDGSATRERLLDSAERLVIEQGFSATSIDQVIEDSRSSKGSFFHHFTSKEALAQALVQRYAAADIAHLEQALSEVAHRAGSPAEQVIAFVRHFEDGAEELMAAQSSCLYVSVLSERQLLAAGASEPILQAVLAWRTALSTLLSAAVPPGSTLDTDALADHVFVTFEGAFVLCRATGDAHHMRAQLATLRQLLESLLLTGLSGRARQA